MFLRPCKIGNSQPGYVVHTLPAKPKFFLGVAPAVAGVVLIKNSKPSRGTIQMNICTKFGDDWIIFRYRNRVRYKCYGLAK